MKKTIIGFTLLSALLVSGSQSVFAVESTSKGNILLTTDETATPPVEPGEEPDDGTTTGMTGSLTIDYVPNFNFVQAQGGLSGTFSDTKTKNVQVTDKRGTGSGWNLDVSITPFKDSDKVIKGATITLPGTAEKGNQVNTSEAITTQENSNIMVNSDVSTPINIAMAGKNEGMGTWLVKFQNASMDIPEGNVLGNYSSTFTWTLSSTPIE
ncbi:WxL domain-containing protein [Enterococcus rivorum]|nr:WxL domain-containing protein [Enterococcus rivorum]MBP2097276.1 hypothetical protein [Enterococcus rivorum]